MALLFDREELTLFSLGAGGLVKSWALPGQKKPLAVSAPIAGAAGLCWSPDRREIWTVPSGGGVQPIQKQSLALGRLILKGVGPMGLIRTMDDGHFAGAAPAGLLLEASPDYGVLHSVSLDADALDVAGIKQDGEIRYLAALTAAGEARFLDAKDLALKKAVPLQGSGEGLRWAFLSDEVRRAVLINQDGGLTAYRLPSGLADGQASAPGPLSAAALDAEGHWLLLGGVDGSLRLWRHPGWQAQFIRVLDAAQAAEQAGHWEMAMQQYSQALAIYPEPSVRADLERVKQARLDQARENTRRMRELSGGH